MPAPVNIAVPASQYTYQELAEIYNQTRIDYIVPMPMNARRMQEYSEHYDIDLDASLVVTTEDGMPVGIGMLGVRGERTWITRLGVLPDQRERHVGSFLMQHLIDSSYRCGAKRVQLEVIVGNEPAQRMFQKFGFKDYRELLIVRRPPKPHVPGTHPLVHELRHLNDHEIPGFLVERDDEASWLEETPSLLNAGQLKGIAIEMGMGERGWAVFMCTTFQIQHVVLSVRAEDYDSLAHALLYYIHELYPNRDTKVENVPVDHPSRLAFQKLQYVTSFRRTEMLLTL